MNNGIVVSECLSIAGSGHIRLVPGFAIDLRISSNNQIIHPVSSDRIIGIVYGQNCSLSIAKDTIRSYNPDRRSRIHPYADGCIAIDTGYHSSIVVINFRSKGVIHIMNYCIVVGQGLIDGKEIQINTTGHFAIYLSLGYHIKIVTPGTPDWIIGISNIYGCRLPVTDHCIGTHPYGRCRIHPDHDCCISSILTISSCIVRVYSWNKMILHLMNDGIVVGECFCKTGSGDTGLIPDVSCYMRIGSYNQVI